MAYVVNDPKDRKRVIFTGLDRKRRTIRLSKMARRDADKVAEHVDAILAAAMSKSPVAKRTAEWLGDIEGVMHEKLVRAGLVQPREVADTTTLGAFLAEYIAGRTDVKPATQAKYKTTQHALEAFFGPGRRLDSISQGDGDAFRRFLKSGRMENTVRKLIATTKVFFGAAKRMRIISENPFADQKSAIQANTARMVFITPEMIAKVIDAAPDGFWRLVIVLARFGGVRVPSELSIQIEDVDFANARLRVRSPKTEHHIGRGERIIPLFPEIRAAIDGIWDQIPAGAAHLLPEQYRNRENLRQQMHRIIRRAGLPIWEKTFQNLRSSRETELAECFPLHVVTAWLGNSQPVALKHYLQVTDAHFASAVGTDKMARIPARFTSEPTRMAAHGEPENQETPCFQGVSRQQVVEMGLEPTRPLRSFGF